MGGPDAFSISRTNLYGRLGTAGSPLLFDVRRGAAFDAAETLIVGALRRDPDDVGAWQDGLRRDRLAVVYCAHGREISRGVAASLRNAGVDARYLEDGIVGWAERGLPCRNKTGPASRQWVTRERPKIDRIACPWVIRRFIDPEAQFLYVPTERVFAVAGETGATAYDIPGAEPFSHEGELCSFDAFLKVYGIRDPALDTLARIVRGADTDRLELSPQSPGLLAFSLGLAANFPNDHAMLEHGMTMYDALYAWCRLLQGETHGWNPELGR
jgi:rhodanese-related sulfurtransferase